MFYLIKGSDGHYYPLAGGAAVAVKQDGGEFALPDEVLGTNAAPSEDKQSQRATPKLPTKLRYKGKTTLLKKALVTDAGTPVTAMVSWTLAGKKCAKLVKSKRVALALVTFGRKPLKVTVNLTAPETDTHLAYSFSKTWQVRK